MGTLVRTTPHVTTQISSLVRRQKHKNKEEIVKESKDRNILDVLKDIRLELKAGIKKARKKI